MTNTINPFDTGDVRAIDIVIHPIQDGREVEKHQNGLGVGGEGDPAYTLDTASAQAIAFYSTGGGNDAPALDVSPALKVGSSLDIASPPAVTYNIFGGNPRPDRPEGGFYVNETDTTKTLDASSGLNPTANQGGTAVLTSTVRRLTPLECERLQGFPDGWTAERYDYKKQQVVPQADSARYKQMGNAIAVPVFAWVLGRLAAAHELLTEQEDVA